MEIIDNTIYFKSNIMFYSKEAHGVKPNTIRTLAEFDHESLINNIFTLEFIQITSADDNTKMFKRQLSDISRFNENTFIFSWFHDS